MQEAARDKNKLVYMNAVKKERKEKETITDHLQYLTKADKKFNPVDQ